MSHARPLSARVLPAPPLWGPTVIMLQPGLSSAKYPMSPPSIISSISLPTLPQWHVFTSTKFISCFITNNNLIAIQHKEMILFVKI